MRDFSLIADSYRRCIDSILDDHSKYINSTRDALERGEDINVKGKGGETAVHIACLDIFNPYLMQNLLRYEPNFNIQNDELQTPLHKYMRTLYIEPFTLESLLKTRADPDIPDAKGNTCLHYLVDHPLRDMIHPKLLIPVLLKYNADINFQNDCGETPLHRALVHQAMDFITAFLHADASVLIKNKENLSAMEIAYSNRNDKPEVFMEIAKFAIILDKCEKPVNQEFLDQIQTIESLRIFNDQCNEELSRLKKIRVGNTTVTLYIILKSSLQAFAKFLRNSEILEWFRNFESGQYKMFGTRIHGHFEQGLARKEAEECGNLFCRNIWQILPENCHDNILSYLDNKDLHNLKWTLRNEREELHIDEIPSD